jgi:hypothetical protein
VSADAAAAPLAAAGRIDGAQAAADVDPSPTGQRLGGAAATIAGTMAAGATGLAGATAAAVDAVVRAPAAAADEDDAADVAEPGDPGRAAMMEAAATFRDPGAFGIPSASRPVATERTEPAGTSAGAQAPAASPPSSAPRATSFPSPRPPHAPARATEARPAIFGSRDPAARAQRMARALVSDIVAYHPKKREESLARGTMRQDFREEIMKSWEEYVAQVGVETAKSTPYFRDALNAILAKGQSVF